MHHAEGQDGNVEGSVPVFWKSGSSRYDKIRAIVLSSSCEISKRLEGAKRGFEKVLRLARMAEGAS
jgi:hypothetical protein